MASMNPLRIAVLGAGPVGLEAALYARALGHDVSVFEKGKIAENLQSWGHVTLFSPWRMNHTPLGRRVLEQSGPAGLPHPEDLLTGAEHARTYLRPLAGSRVLSGRILEKHRVISVGREDYLKGEAIGSPERLESPFRILAEAPAGEKIFLADRVLDTTGTYGNPNWMGAGGIAAPGERAARDRISYELDDPTGRDRERYRGKRTLLVGGGYSAATSALAFERLAKEDPRTVLLWATRDARPRPFDPHPGDPLPGRLALVEDANRLASQGSSGIRRLPGRHVDSIEPLADGAMRVVLRSSVGLETHTVERILANVGYQPERSLYTELQIHECYASFGPMKLAAALLEGNSKDCLDQKGRGAETLLNPEPGFLILGSKSYGRGSTFLLRIGFEQVRDAFRIIQDDANLDLYTSPPATLA
jgi:Pyridine nucleotide-disulphide oxidoreductase